MVAVAGEVHPLEDAVVGEEVDEETRFILLISYAFPQDNFHEVSYPRRLLLSKGYFSF